MFLRNIFTLKILDRRTSPTERSQMMCLFIVLTFLNINAQKDTVIKRYGNYYKVCICSDIKRLNCNDSIKGIMFLSADLKDFPEEVFRYKNLEIIDFSNFTWEQKYKELSLLQKRKYNKAYKVRNSVPYIPYKFSRITKVPDEIRILKKLKLIGLYATEISDQEIDRVLKILPGVIIY